VHAAHRKALLPFSGPIFIEDTDELATAVWVEMLMQKQLPSIEIKIKLPFLYLLMDPTVPFASEKTRYFDKEDRVTFFEKIKNKLDGYNASYQILTGPWASREIEAKIVVKKLLSEKLNWSQLS
jgi:nicotinamide riboside kinase